MTPRGFTLVELVMVIVITGILAVMGTVFLKPAIDAYFGTQRRAALTDLADTALRRIGRDVRSAVPNSIRWPNSQCLELLPTSTGGRYRMEPDTVSGGSAALDIAQPVDHFDVLSDMSVIPAVGDWVVIDNEANSNDAYAGINRAAISGVTTPLASAGVARIAISSTQFPSGYGGGRFVIVPNNGGNPAVVYVCSGADGTVDASGDGKGSLYRLTRAFSPTYPSSCPSSAGGAILVNKVKTCNLLYNASQDGTQQSALVWIELEITSANESIALTYGVHVDNVP